MISICALESRKIKYLGLIMDDRLTWRFHINELCKKLGRAVGMFYKLRHLCPKKVLRSLYYSLFNSHLTYGLPVWGNTAKILINKLDMFQRYTSLSQSSLNHFSAIKV